MRRGKRRHLMPTTLLVASAMLLAGCFTVETTFTISDDGTVDLELVSLIDTQKLADLSESFGEGFLDFGDLGDLGDLGGAELIDELTEGENPCGELTDSLLDYEVTTTEISDGTMVGVSCTVQDVPFEDLRDLGADSFLTIEQDESGTRFELVLEGADELSGGDGADITALLGIDLDELFVLRFKASAPGSLSDNNATSTDGATATWLLTTDAPFISNGAATMTASWVPSASGTGSAIWIVVAIVAALLAIGLVVFLIIRRSKGSGEDPTENDPAIPVASPPNGVTTTAPPPPPPPPSPPPSTPEPGAPLAPPPPPSG